MYNVEYFFNKNEDKTSRLSPHPLLSLLSLFSLSLSLSLSLRRARARVLSGETAWVMNEEFIEHGPAQPTSKCMATNIFVNRFRVEG